MLDLPSLRRETRYGMPAADQIMFNRHFVVGYSYYFRQPKWTLEIVDPPVIDERPNEDVDRADNFRPDFRVPPMFRADLVDFARSGFDRGHLVPSADQKDVEIQNSETFLLSNMSPQAPQFNRNIWRKLESAVRDLNDREDVLETYVVSGPLFDFDQTVSVIGSDDPNGVSIPVPHAYFKSILIENNRGQLHMWSFMLANRASTEPLSSFLVPTALVETWAGILLWERLVGPEIEEEKNRIRNMF